MNRRSLIIVALTLLCAANTRASDELWTGNKLTNAQPFPASVRAVLPSWVGYHLLLEEISGGRLCVARVWHSAPLEYALVEDTQKEVAAEPERKKEGWIYLSPAIEVNRFSWSVGAFKIGRIFGDEDVLQKVAKAQPGPKK